MRQVLKSTNFLVIQSFLFCPKFENCSIKFWLKYAKHRTWDVVDVNILHKNSKDVTPLEKQKSSFHKKKGKRYKTLFIFWNKNHIAFHLFNQTFQVIGSVCMCWVLVLVLCSAFGQPGSEGSDDWIVLALILSALTAQWPLYLCFFIGNPFAISC